MRYLLIKIRAGRLSKFNSEYKKLFQDKKSRFVIIQTEENQLSKHLRKASISYLHVDSPDDTTAGIEKLLSKHRRAPLYIVLNIITALMFTAVLLYFLEYINRDKRLFLDSLFVAYIKQLTLENNENMQVFTEDRYIDNPYHFVLSVENRYISVYGTDSQDLFIIPYLNGLKSNEMINILDNYRDIFLSANLENSEIKLSSIFDFSTDIYMGKEIFIISHPFGILNTKAYGIINGAYNDIYGHVYYTSNAPISNDMIGALVTDKSDNFCGIILPVYSDYWSKKFKPGIFGASFLKRAMENNQNEQD